MFLKDKYSPKTIDDTFFHKEIIQKLHIMSKDSMMPNIIFSGPSGAGKNTIVKLFLEMLYDSDVNKMNDVTHIVPGSGNTIHEIKIKQSNYHIVIEPNNFDRHLIQDIVKEYAKRIPINVFKTKIMFRTVLINDVNKLSYYAQTSLRRTMEKYSNNCRFILVSSLISKVLEPLRSRCVIFNINRPNNVELFEYIFNISINENIKINFKDICNLINKANGDIKNALWMLELIKYDIHTDNSYAMAINEIVKLIIDFNNNDKTVANSKNIAQFNAIINIFYKILITNISGSLIIKDVMMKLCELDAINENKKYEIVITSAKYESRLIKGRREIIHLQGFLCKIMQILKK